MNTFPEKPPKEAVLTAVVMHVGWEMDNEAWLERTEDGCLVAYHTSHGGLRYCSREYLEKKISETLASAAQLQALLDFPGVDWG